MSKPFLNRNPNPKDSFKEGKQLSYNHSVYYHNSNKKQHIAYGKRSIFINKYLKINIIKVVITILLLIGLFAILRINSGATVYFVGDNPSVDTYLKGKYEASIVKTASNYVNSSILNQTKVFFNRNNLKNLLMKDYGFIDNINIQTKLFSNNIDIYIFMGNPVIYYSNKNNNYLIDQNGQLENTNYIEPILGQMKLIHVTDQGVIPLKLGEYLLSTQEVTEIEEIYNKLSQDNGYNITNFVLNENGSEIDAYFSKFKYFAKFNLLEGGINLQIGRFLAIEKYLTANKIIPNSYIDVRVDGRVYYK